MFRQSCMTERRSWNLCRYRELARRFSSPSIKALRPAAWRGAQERSASENGVTALELAGPDEDAEIGGPVDVAGQDALGEAQLTGGCEWLGSDERKALRVRARRINISFRTIDPIAVSGGKI